MTKREELIQLLKYILNDIVRGINIDTTIPSEIETENWIIKIEETK